MEPNEPVLDSQELFDAPLPQEKRGHPSALLLLSIAKLMERMGFYGFYVALYSLFSDGLGLEYEFASDLHGIFGGAVLMGAVAGGVLGDRVLSNRNALVLGAILLLLGGILVLFPAFIPVLIGLGLVGIGTALYGPNSLALMGRHYHNRKSTTDAGFMWYHLALNAGGVICTVLVVSMSEIFGNVKPFGGPLIGALAHFGGLAVLLGGYQVLKPPAVNRVSDAGHSTPRWHGLGPLAIVLLCFIPFSILGNITYGNLYSGVQHFFDLVEDFNGYRLVFEGLPFLVTLLVTIPLAIYFARTRQSVIYRLGVGFFIGALPAVILLLFPPSWPQLVLFITLYAAGELLTGPLLLAFTSHSIRPHNLGLASGMVLFAHGIITLFSRHFYRLELDELLNQNLMAVLAILVALALGGVAIYLGRQWQQSQDKNMDA